MSSPLVIRHHFSQQVSNNAEAVSVLSQQLQAFSSLPDDIVIISAGEVKPLTDPLVSEFVDSLKSSASVSFISAACVSFHAAILDFYRRSEMNEVQEQLIISLEIDKGVQQGCLNSLGIGNEADQDGLDVHAGVGLLWLSRTFQPGDTSISGCQIVSQPKGMSGISIVINQLSKAFAVLPDTVKPVSFDICSNWGKKLLKGLDARLPAHRKSEHWLSSLEPDEAHFLTLKLVMELDHYLSESEQSDLFIMTLGGGGRIGLLTVSNQQINNPTIDESSFSEFELEQDLQGYRHALAEKQHDIAAYYEQVKQTLKYPQAEYRGVNNHYFVWR